MTETQQAGAHPSAATGVHKKKFATPPVKIACLACRASRTRCDGGHPCASCKTRSRDCIYKPSRRGGARVRKKPRAVQDDGAEGAEVPGLDAGELMLQERMPNEPPEPIAIENYVDPGAGLAHLQDWSQDSDFIFDSLFMGDIPGMLSGGSGDSSSDMSSIAAAQLAPMVRTYKSDQDILDAYYIFIHPFLPILPPPSHIAVDQPIPRLQNQVDEFEEAFEPSSPISLAISAVLALIPCPNDPNYATPDSVLFRRKYSYYLAQAAIENIELENEIPDSSIEPPRAFESEEPLRLAFHPSVPPELESIVALDILSIYEYSQRGNLKKMQSRSGQALVAAMAQSLHLSIDEECDLYAEAKRRIWWMTYLCVSQASIVSNSKPPFEMFAPSFTRSFPTLAVDTEAYAVFIRAQQAILAATQFVIDLNKTMQANADMSRVYDKMKELETLLEPLNNQAESWTFLATATSPVDPTEEVISRSLRSLARIKLNSARIKLHRYSAFYDLPVFAGKFCDLTSQKTGNTPKSEDLNAWPSCHCSMALPPARGHGSTTPPSGAPWPSPDSDENHVHQHSPGEPGQRAVFPFSSHLSAKICLKSALSIAASFEALPYPNPEGRPGLAQCFLGPTSTIVAPRTMPSFACCAMQCAYSLLMVHNKTKSMYPENNGGSFLVESLLLRLQSGLVSILATLENYGSSFEALGGMRDQVRGAMQPFWPIEMKDGTVGQL